MSQTVRNDRGFTYLEAMIAVAIVALFFGALYALNAQCLYLLNSGRESTAAGHSLQDRIEQLRSCGWDQITDANYIRTNILNASTLSGNSIANSSETITLTTYPAATTPLQVIRTNGSATITSSNPSIANGDLVRVNVALNWSSGLGARARSQSVTSLIAKNIP